MMPLLLGLFSWIVMGLAAGLFAARFLPGEPRLSGGLLAAVGLAGALLGGFLATALGFGGLAGFDFRGLLVATLGAMLLLLVVRLMRLEA